jgi:hypothetical protein
MYPPICVAQPPPSMIARGVQIRPIWSGRVLPLDASVELSLHMTFS